MKLYPYFLTFITSLLLFAYLCSHKKLQQVITVSTNLIFNFNPSPGPIKVNVGVISPELVKHPNFPENSQEEWDLEKVSRELLNLPKKKEITKRVIPKKLKLFLTFLLEVVSMDYS